MANSVFVSASHRRSRQGRATKAQSGVSVEGRRDVAIVCRAVHPLYIEPMDPLPGLEDLTFDHIALGVKEIEGTLPLVSLLGGVFLRGADHLRNQFRWVQFELPGKLKLELLAPIGPDSFMNRFLETRGEGFHHVTFRVPDVTTADARAQELGFTTTGLSLHPDWSEVFIHPRSANGLMVQLAQWDSLDNWTGPSLEDVLAGKSLDHT